MQATSSSSREGREIVAGLEAMLSAQTSKLELVYKDHGTIFKRTLKGRENQKRSEKIHQRTSRGSIPTLE